MTFEEALSKLKRGECMERAGWVTLHGLKGAHVQLNRESKIPQFILRVDPKHLQSGSDLKKLGTVVGWTPSTADLLAEDWQIYERI